jgi:thiol:disulfide interchange protein
VPRGLCLLTLLLAACGAPTKTATPAPDASAAPSAASVGEAGTPTAEVPPDASAPTTPDETDPQIALATAKKEGKPAFLFACAKWVAACGEVAHVLVEPGVRKTLEERFVVARIDVSNDEDPATKDRMKKYNVKGLPLMIVFDRKGKEVARESGYLDASRIVKLLDKVK